MMFMAMFIVFVLIVLFIVLVLSLITCGILTIVFHKCGKTNKTCRVLKYISLVLSIGSFVLLIPFGIVFLIGVSQFTRVPYNFVNCEIKAEFMDDGMHTSDGKIYEFTGFWLNQNVEMEPIFSYEPKGLLKKCEWGNVYKLGIDNGFSLYAFRYNEVSNYYLYAEKSDADKVEEFYKENHKWEKSWWSKLDFNDDIILLMEKYHYENSAQEIIVKEHKSYAFDALSNDNSITLYSCEFWVTDDSVYLVTENEYGDYVKNYGFILEGDEEKIIRDAITKQEKKDNANLSLNENSNFNINFSLSLGV